MDHFNSNAIAMRREERAAASRQKSCNACVRGKRRCDKRAPSCSRCTAKGLECVYQRMPPGAPTMSGASSDAPEMCEVPEFDMGFEMESLGTETSPESLQADSGIHLGGISGSRLDDLMDPALDFSIVDLLTTSSSATDNSFWDIGPTHHGDTNKMEIPSVPVAPPIVQQPIRDLAVLHKSEETCFTVDPLEVYDNRSRVGYIFSCLTTIPEVFARKRCLPFIHPRLWTAHIPKSMMSAFTVTTAYQNRTPENRGWTTKLIMDTARDILREGETAQTPVEKLARVQALVLLNSIRVFDGDIALRAAAEREMVVFSAWLKDLIDVVAELEGGVSQADTMSRDRPPKTWESWVQLESARRSAIFAGAFICLVKMLKGEEMDCQADPEFWLWNKTFTASKHLWEAESSTAFYRSWREKPQYCIVNFNFKDVWTYAREDDIDDFTKMMLTSQLGVDALENFLHGETTVST